MRKSCLEVSRFGVALWTLLAAAQPRYDLLLKGGHVIDPANHVSAVRDVAIGAGKILAVAKNIPAASANKTVDVSQFYITPGLVDIHSHVMTMSGLRGSLPEDQNVWADSHTFRSGVTTVVDAGTSGWQNFQSRRRAFSIIRVNSLSHEESRTRTGCGVLACEAPAKRSDRVVGYPCTARLPPDGRATSDIRARPPNSSLPLMADMCTDPER